MFEQNELDSSQREVAQLKSKQIELSKVKRSLENSVKTQKEEIKKMKGNQLHLKKQFEHDIRKGQREMAKLKEKLVQVNPKYNYTGLMITLVSVYKVVVSICL